MSMVAVGPVSACGDRDIGNITRVEARPLVAYSREGGVQFQSSSLVVSTEGMAIVQSEGCKARFRLDNPSWQRLRRVLERADLPALADGYPASPGVADAIEETIVAGPDVLRIADLSSLPERAQRRLMPLLNVLTETLAKGRRHPSSTC
jgi:hypothetical protein